MKREEKQMHELDLPEAYDQLRPLEKEILTYWIEHAICGAVRYSKRSSYGIKHDFEREGFYITNGQFKGAMLAAGYQPKSTRELNWIFKITPCKDLSLPSDDPGWFRIGKDQPKHQRYADLLGSLQAEYRREAEGRENQQEAAQESS